ncbi:MAG: hypothetical protein K8H88_20820, partial [Sandaracinaceae bacterium]|nr:hypothetical protein [Sandaracinaceae bacterium]
GYLTAGVMGRVLHEHGRVLGVMGRLVLPTTTGLDHNNQPLAFEVSSTAGFAATPNFRFHAWLGLIASLGLNAAAPFQGRAGVRVGGGADWHPWEWLGVVLEIATGFGYRDALDFFALQPGLRFAFGPEVAMELSASVPLAGAERALAAAWLMLTWTR